MSPSDAWGWWVAACVAGGWWAVDRAGWESCGLAVPGLLLGSWALAVGGLCLGAGFRQVALFRQAVARRDAQEAAAEQFLEQLILVSASTPSLAQAVDKALPPRLRPLARRVDRLGEQLAREWPLATLRQAAPAWSVLSRHGGPVDRFARQLLAQLQLERRMRWERAAALAGPRGTVAVLALAPLVVVVLFWVVVPSFFTVIVTTLMGQAAVICSGGVGCVVLWVAHHDREEGARG